MVPKEGTRWKRVNSWFGPILFSTVPKGVILKILPSSWFYLFDMVPKVKIILVVRDRRFGTILFNMIPKETNEKSGSFYFLLVYHYPI